MSGTSRLAAALAVAAGSVLSLAPPAWAACHRAEFTPSSYRVAEKDEVVTITIENPGPVPGDRTVDFETVDGTARGGADYVAASGTLTFSVDDTTITIQIKVIDDTADERDETFRVRLTARDGSCITDLDDPATVTIADDDPAPSPSPTATKTGPGPSPSKSASPSPSPTATTPSPSPTATASPPGDDGGLSGGAVAGIVAGAVAAGGGAIFAVRRRYFGSPS